MPGGKKAPKWLVYLLRCRDGSLYCGITTDLKRRVSQHNSGTGAKYVVPARRPAVCAWKRAVKGKSEALKLEVWIKRQATAVKAAIVDRRLRPGILRDGRPGVAGKKK